MTGLSMLRALHRGDHRTLPKHRVDCRDIDTKQTALPLTRRRHRRPPVESIHFQTALPAEFVRCRRSLKLRLQPDRDLSHPFRDGRYGPCATLLPQSLLELSGPDPSRVESKYLQAFAADHQITCQNCRWSS